MNTSKHDRQPILADASEGYSESDESEELDGQMDYEDNLTYHEDSLSIMCGTVQSDKVWVVTDTGSLTQLVQYSYASRMGMKRIPIRLNKQFDIKSLGRGYETIKEKVQIEVKLKMRKSQGSDGSLDFKNLSTVEEKNILMSFGIISKLPVPLLWGGRQMKGYSLLDIHEMKLLSMSLEDNCRWVTDSMS
jgi:hypothetical protein